MSIDAAPSGTDAKVDPALRALLNVPGSARPIDVQILVRDASPTVIAELKKMGLIILTAPGRNLQLRGRIASDKLMALAQHNAVRYIVAVGK